MSDSTRVRVRGDDRQLLKDLKEMESVREEAVEEGLIEDRESTVTYETLLFLAIPDDANPVSRDDMRWLNARGAKSRIKELAGENVSNHEVVTKFVREFAEQHGVQS